LGVTTQTFGYDDAGNQVWAKDANGKGNYFTYNKLRQLLTITDELNHTDSLSYNTLGQLTQVKNAKGQTTSFTYDVMGWLETVTDPMNGLVTYTRDNLGNITNINDAKGKNTQITYNSHELPSLIKYPGTTTYQRSFVYDNEGLLKSYTDEDNIMATLTRDDNHFVTNIAYSNGKSESFTRDANGWLTSATNTQGTITFTRDNVGNITKINDVFGQDIAYTYDKVYNRTSVTYPGGTIATPHTVTTTYNELNLPTQTTDWLGNYAKRFYNDNYQLDSLYNSNGSSTKIIYDDLRRITRYVNREVNGAVINQHLLTYDKNNRIIKDESTLPVQITLTNKIETYTREDDGRLNQAGTKVYTQNKRGARTATTGTSSESYTWGQTNLLTSYTKDGVTTNNHFDVFGNRIKKEKAGDQTRYLLDLNSDLPQILEEQDNAGNTKASYIYTPNALGWRLDENNKASFYAYSFNGHTLGLTNETGLLTDKYAYDLFGDHATHVGSSPQPFTYLGKFGIMEESKGFYHIRARFYDASIGAFISKDSYPASTTNTQSLNRYHYGFNDPLTFVDVDGLTATDPYGQGSIMDDQDNGLLEMANQHTQFSSIFPITARELMFGQNQKQQDIMRQNDVGLGYESFFGPHTTISSSSFTQRTISEVKFYVDDKVIEGSNIDRFEVLVNIMPIGGSVGTKGVSKVGSKALSLLNKTRGGIINLFQRNSRVKQGSVALAKNLIASGISRPANVQAHHIVAVNAPRAQIARNILARAGIDINDAINGVFLPTKIHQSIHTKNYYIAINQRLQNTTNVRLELQKIAEDILNGTFTYN